MTLSCVLNPEIIAERVDERATRLQAAPLHKAANQGTQIAEGGHVVKKKIGSSARTSSPWRVLRSSIRDAKWTAKLVRRNTGD